MRDVESRAKPRWLGSVLLVVAVICGGLVGSSALVITVNRAQDNHLSEVMNQRADAVDTAVSSQLARYVATASDLAIAVGVQSNLTASDFGSLTSGLTRERLPGVSGVALVVAASDSQLPRVQQQWRTAGNQQLSLAPAGLGGEHFFIVLGHPLDRTPVTTGQDLSRIAEPSQALLSSRSSQQVTASATFVLLKDRQLPASRQQLSFVLAAPIHGGAGTPDAGKFRGWLVIGLRGADFIEETMRLASEQIVAVSLLDASTGKAVPVARFSDGPLLGETRLRRVITITVAGRRWQLVVEPTKGFTATTGPRLGVPVGAAGLLFTALLAALLAALTTSRNRAWTKVDKATAELRADIERRELIETALRQREDELQEMALTDSLTGLANHRAFLDRLEQAHARALRQKTHLAVVYGDVDRFKAINDTYGHAAGDAVLRQVAARLRAHFRTEDTVGRLGGDEFAVICENFTSEPAGLIKRLRATLAAPYCVRDQPIHATVSVGLASAQAGESSERLLERADQTMYVAKGARHS
jgi:diguanylate cyclase (GGDEF)-like protein